MIERSVSCTAGRSSGAITLIRGDRFTFVADWTAGQRNEMRLQMVELRMVDLMPPLHRAPRPRSVAMLLGTWSGRGRGEYPTIESFDYDETITFGHVGKPFLVYGQRTRSLGRRRRRRSTPRPATGGSPTPGRVELVLSHPSGITEVEEGSIDPPTAVARRSSWRRPGSDAPPPPKR